MTASKAETSADYFGDCAAAAMPAASGQAESLEEAKVQFLEAWASFYASQIPHDIAHWHHHQDAAAERFGRK